MKKHLLIITCVLLLSACQTLKQSANKPVSNTAVNIQLDTLSVNADKENLLSYQPSETRINDIIHTKLDVSFDWTKQYLFGKATLTIKPYFYPVSTLELDARGMEIKEVALVIQDSIGSIKKPLQYSYTNDVIAIKLNRTYNHNQQYTVFIDYVSKPNELKNVGGSDAITSDRGLYFINPLGTEKDKPQQVWTQGETQSSCVWFPTIDRPNERMTQEINITVDKKYTTLSNGELAFSIENDDSTRTDYWKMNLPHAPYLAMMMVGDFAIIKDTWHDKEVSYYVEREYESFAKNIFGNTPEMLEFYSKRLGVEFPWNKYAQVVARDYVSGAMENTTAALFGEFVQRTDRELLDKNYEYVVAHELFHEWFGDLVTCESWSNLPLNESFATYGEYLWEEYKYGMDAADYHSAQSREGYLEEASDKQVNLVRFYYSNREDMFDAHSYNKGGQVLHMLRKYVGDEAFFAALKLYLETNKFSSVEIHQLRLAFEQITGEDLNWFFNQWFLSPGHPELVIKQEYESRTGKLKLNIKQIQDLNYTPLFKLPIAVDIYENGEKTRHKIVVEKANQEFEFTVAHKPDLVNVDAEKMLLCTKDEQKSIAELAFQYRNAPLYLDRYEALMGLSKQAKDSVASEVIVEALNDEFWNMRISAIKALKDVNESAKAETKNRLVQMAQKDRRPKVRTAAINYLSDNVEDEKLFTVYKQALTDKSYMVMGAALNAVAKANAQEGIALAKQYETEKNTDVLTSIAELYADFGTADNNDFFVQSEPKFKSYSKIGFVRQYVAFLKHVNNDELMYSGADLLRGIAQKEEANKWVAGYAKKGIKDVAAVYDEKVLILEQKLKAGKQLTPEAVADLQKQKSDAQAKQQKIMEVYNSLR